MDLKIFILYAIYLHVICTLTQDKIINLGKIKKLKNTWDTQFQEYSHSKLMRLIKCEWIMKFNLKTLLKILFSSTFYSINIMHDQINSCKVSF